MNKEKFNIWLKALKSGKYTRSTNRLRTSVSVTETQPAGYCCLGVACDLASKDLGISWDGRKFDGADIALPQSVVEWLEIDPEIIRCVDNTSYYFNVIDKNGDSSDICNVNDYSTVADFGEVIAALERTFPDLVEQDADTSVQG